MRNRAAVTFGTMKHLLLISSFVMLAACGDGKKEAAEQQMAADSTSIARYTVDLASFDVPLQLDLGDLATLGVDSAQVRWNEEFGWLEVRAGEGFAVTIAEEPADLVRLMADLERDMLQKHTVIRESPELLVYRSQFPDEDLVFVHFYRIIRVNDRTFVMQDAPGGRFNEADVARMSASVGAQQPV